MQRPRISNTNSNTIIPLSQMPRYINHRQYLHLTKHMVIRLLINTIVRCIVRATNAIMNPETVRYAA